MSHKKTFKNFFVLVPLAVLLLLVFNTNNTGNHIQENIDPDERPDYAIDPDEQAFYDQISEKKQSQLRMKSISTVESYAEGKVKGTWSAKQFSIPNKVNYGFRTIGSAYDKEEDIVYVVSHAGHIWRIDYNEIIPTQTRWTSMNHSHAFMTTSRKEWFDIININDGNTVSSRMLRSYNNKIEYSDDEGRNWQQSTGVSFQDTDNQGCVAGSSKGDRAVVLAKISAVKDVAISYDGINYVSCGLNLTTYSYDTKLLKPHNSDNIYVIARHKTTSKLSVYRMTPDSEEFVLLYSPFVTVDAPTRVIGTYVDDSFHFYYIQGNENYYSADEGATWSKTTVTDYGNTDGNSFVRTVHPYKPEVLFRGYLDVYMSSNKGASFSNWGHKLGWDVHHMRMYQRKDGSYMHLIGKDFGVFLSKTPELRDSYFSINHSSPAQMAYDMTVSDNFSTVFTACQDRGSMSFKNLWVLGNYSRFVRPGYVRLNTVGTDDSDFMGSSYLSPDSSKLVSVYINTTIFPVTLDQKMTLPEGYAEGVTDLYATTKTSDLQYRGETPQGEVITLPGRSVCTTVTQLSKSTSIKGQQENISNLTIYPNPLKGKMIHFKGLNTGDNIRIHSTSGRLLMENTVEDNAANYALESDLDSGVYLLSVSGRYGEIHQKLVVE